MSNSLEALPPEMQARIANILAQGQAHNNEQAMPEQPMNAVPAANAPAPLATRPPSLMDHIVALRQEVAALSQQVQATAQVTEAVGNAVGQMYQMFQVQTQPTSYSTNFQTQKPGLNDDDEF
tara:strand:- start:936 stop:1301 length:366 start_codon:yes stop_codon:yes gene_type:complete